MGSFNGEYQFVCPTLSCLMAGQGEIFFMSHHKGRARETKAAL